MKNLLLAVALHLTAGQAAEPVFYPASFYSNDTVRALFQNVEFSDPNVTVTKITEYRKKGRMIVKFGDVSQLEDSLDQGVALNGSKVYFSYKPGRGTINYGEGTEMVSGYKISGPSGLLIRGTLRIPGLYLYLPSYTKLLLESLLFKGSKNLDYNAPLKNVVKFIQD